MINTIEPIVIVIDPLSEVSRIIELAVREEVNTARQRAATCGCRGCKAQAADAVLWATRMMERSPGE